MFKCCLCGQEYMTKEAAVKCVNECGRRMASDGAFTTKTAKQDETVNNYEYDEIFKKEYKDFKKEITTLSFKLINSGAPEQQIFRMKENAFNNWNLKSLNEKEVELKRFEVLASLYSL